MLLWTILYCQENHIGSVLSGESYRHVREFIREDFIILACIFLPGDAFCRASARVKTSILILRSKKNKKAQGDVFMASAIYVGLEHIIAERIGIPITDLEKQKLKEIGIIVSIFRDFRNGVNGDYVVPVENITSRIDVKFCINDRGRKKENGSMRD